MEDKNENIAKGYDYGINLVISLYFDDNEVDKHIFETLEKAFYKQTYLPDYNYTFALNDNTLDTRTNRANSYNYPEGIDEIKLNKDIN